MRRLILLFVIFTLLCVSVFADSASQLEKLAHGATVRLREAQHHDREWYVNQGRNQCADIVLHTMKDISEAKYIVDLFQSRVQRQNVTHEWYSRNRNRVVELTRGALDHNRDVRVKAWEDLARFRKDQRVHFKRRVHAVQRAFNMVKKLNSYFSFSDHSTIPAQFTPAEIEDERFFLSFLETETEISASAEVDFGLDMQTATVEAVASAVETADNELIKDHDPIVSNIFSVVQGFLRDKTLISSSSYNPYSLRLLTHVASELTAHQQRLVSFQRFANSAYDDVDNVYSLGLERQLTSIDLTPLQVAVARAEDRVDVAAQALEQAKAAHKEMRKVLKQYTRSLEALRKDCNDQNEAFKERSLTRKDAVDMLETKIVPHIGAYGDLFGEAEAREVAASIYKVDPAVHVDGGWTPWGFGLCDAPCGLGRQTIYRSCSHPAPKNGGTICAGRATIRNYPCNVGICTPEAILAYKKTLNTFYHPHSHHGHGHHHHGHPAPGHHHGNSTAGHNNSTKPAKPDAGKPTKPVWKRHNMAQSTYTHLPQLKVGVTPDFRNTVPFTSGDGAGIIVSDVTTGTIYSYAEGTEGKWSPSASPLGRFEVEFGQASQVSPDGNTAIICSKWRCALYSRVTEAGRPPLPVYNKTTGPTPVEKVWKYVSPMNNKVIRYPRPTASSNMTTVAIADRCDIHQYKINNGTFTEQPMLSVITDDCQNLGWNTNTAATVSSISGNGKVIVATGSCAHRTYCADSSRFTLAFIFVNGETTPIRLVIPSHVVSDVDINEDGSVIVFGTPADKTAMVTSYVNGTYTDVSFVDPHFSSDSKREDYNTNNNVGMRVKMFADAKTAGALTGRKSVAPIKNMGANATATATAHTNGAANSTQSLLESETESEVDNEAEEENEEEFEDDGEYEMDDEAEEETMFLESETAVNVNMHAQREAELVSALAIEHAEDSAVEQDATTPGLAFVEMYQSARAKVEDALGYASSQRAHAKTIDIPVPTATSVDLYFGNRVAISEDGLRLGVQALRTGRVCVEMYSRDNTTKPFVFSERVLVPWTTGADYDSGFSMNMDATTIVFGSIRGAFTVATRATPFERFTIPKSD